MIITNEVWNQRKASENKKANVGKLHLGNLTNSFRPALPEQDPSSALHKLGILDELEHHGSLMQ